MPGRIEFAVEDDGPGIDVFDLPLIFEKFYRGRQRTTNAKGSGMGLAIARAILTAHGGGIEAESAPGKGATFRLWVPLVEKGDSAALASFYGQRQVFVEAGGDKVLAELVDGGKLEPLDAFAAGSFYVFQLVVEEERFFRGGAELLEK